jgi:hypothetical protein
MSTAGAGNRNCHVTTANTVATTTRSPIRILLNIGFSSPDGHVPANNPVYGDRVRIACFRDFLLSVAGGFSAPTEPKTETVVADATQAQS